MYKPQLAAAFVKDVMNITAVSDDQCPSFLIFIMKCVSDNVCLLLVSMMRWEWWMLWAHAILSALPLR